MNPARQSKAAERPSGGAEPAPQFFSPQVSRARRFYLDLKPSRRTKLTVVSGGCEHCRPDYLIHRAGFPFYSLEFVARGRGTARLRGRVFPLQPGRVFAYGPGVRHELVSDPEDPLVKYFVDFTGTAARKLLLSCRLAPGRAAQLYPANEIQALFDELIRCGSRDTSCRAQLCVRLLQCLALKLAESRAPLAGAQSLAHATYQHCRQHLQQHFQRLKTLRQIAQECHVDGAYLCRLFRRFDHQSPYQCLMRLKMNLAAEWLQEPGALIKQVSERAGFADPFHFSRAFKAVFGLSPEAFRRLR